MDQSQGTPVLPTKATLDQPVASGLPDMEAVSAKMSQVQPRSGESQDRVQYKFGVLEPNN